MEGLEAKVSNFGHECLTNQCWSFEQPKGKSENICRPRIDSVELNSIIVHFLFFSFLKQL